MISLLPNPASSPGVKAGAAPSATQPGRHWFKWLLIVVTLLVIPCILQLRRPPRLAELTRGGARGGALPVAAEAARTAVFDVRLVALGTVTPVYTATVHSRVDGELQKIYFKEGTNVDAGAPLADLDPRPFEVQKLQAEAQLAKDHALLDDARLDLERYQTLLGQDSVAKQQVDTQSSLVRQYEAALKVDDAQVASAALQLTYSHITAPVAGRIGLRLVDQGNIVHAADVSGIAVITQLRPITVLFSIPEDSVPKVMKRFATGEPMTVEAFDRDGRTSLATGKLLTVDNQVDPTTGTVKLRAEFANADDTLFPNQFVNIELVVEQLKKSTVVPTAAVQRGTAGTFVYIVSDKKTVAVRPVDVGPSEKGIVVISKGLVPGDVVVVDGVDKLRDGSAVDIISRTSGTSAGASTKPEKTSRSGAHGDANTVKN